MADPRKRRRRKVDVSLTERLAVSVRPRAAEWQTAGVERAALRRAVADYMASEGCSCCRNVEAHQEHKARLGKLLRVQKYADGSGYDFGRYETPRKS